jgi:hypothetical protein
MDQLTLLDLPVTCSRAAVQDQWHANPARLSFLDYMNRCIWGAPYPDGSRDCIDRKLFCDEFSCGVSQKENEYKNGEDPKYGSWGVAVPIWSGVAVHFVQLVRWSLWKLVRFWSGFLIALLEIDFRGCAAIGPSWT